MKNEIIVTSSAVKLQAIVGESQIARFHEDVSPTLYDECLSSNDALRHSEDTLHIQSLDEAIALAQTEGPISANRILLDWRRFDGRFSEWLIYLAPALYRWIGREFALILPEDRSPTKIIPAIADLLRSLELRSRGIRIISCPTCARCRTNFPVMVKSIEDRLAAIDKTLDVAVMGCEVNGPGEAKAADIGIAFGDRKGMLFKRGEPIRTVNIEDAADVLLSEIEKL